ncbi:MAG: SGNH/GDSL hydrolase family protein [Ruminococcaceae bacterium]|nr:SGNH/GDSL hydrolase family protein [Oscillospiraceae bacterium]
MKLTTKELKALAHGTVSVKDTDDGYTAFYRFSDRQMAYYEKTNTEFYIKSRCTASVRLEMVTDATALSFSYRAKKAATRRFCYFDLFVDGVMVAHEGKDPIDETTDTVALPLPEGTHRIALYLPALFSFEMKDVTLTDATFATPVTKKLKMLAMGDSITHGYDAVYAALSYVNITADALDASVVNQAIGAEIFNPGLIDADLDFTPDVITVAYGTNDYSKCTREQFTENATAFYAKLRPAFPAAKIFALLPIWRGDSHRVTAVGTFTEAKEIVRAAAEAQEGITVIDCDTFVPHLPAFFSDKYLHPNDLGFQCYAAGLLRALQAHL